MVDDDVCTGTFLGHFCHVISFVLQVINVLGKMHRSFTTYVENDKWNVLYENGSCGFYFITNMHISWALHAINILLLASRILVIR